MDSMLSRESLAIGTKDRILNEFESKILNEEQMDRVLRSRKEERKTDHSEIVFRCECDEQGCGETIIMSTEEYVRMHHKSKHFIVIPSHVRLDLEDIITSFKSYTLVAKFFPYSRRQPS